MPYSRSTHWRSLRDSDRELYDLCYWRVAEECPEFDDPEMAPAAIGVTFGSRIGMLTLDEIDSEAIALFGWGYCAFLALAIHDLTGYQLAIFSEAKTASDEDWSGHAAVVLPDGSFLDIQGTSDARSINRRYRLPEDQAPEYLDRDSFCRTTFAEDEYTDGPYGFLDPLELKFLHHFAALTVASARP